MMPVFDAVQWSQHCKKSRPSIPFSYKFKLILKDNQREESNPSEFLTDNYLKGRSLFSLQHEIRNAISL